MKRRSPILWPSAALPALLLLCAGSGPGCKSCKPTRAKRAPGHLVFHIGSEPPHLNPLIQEDYWLHRITVNNLFESLIRRRPGPPYDFLPNLATQWRFSADQRVLAVTLRAGVRWHDGQPFGADDVIFTFDRLMDPKVATAPARSDFVELARWEKVGPLAVKLTFKRATFKLLSSISHLSILPKHIYGSGDLNRHPANHRPVGTGPFRFKSWQRGSRIQLVRWSGYWGPKPALARVSYRLIRSREKAFDLCKRGELDILPRVPPQLLCGAKPPVEDPRISKHYRLLVHYPVQFYTAVFNTKNPLFADARVRRALAHLVDRELIAKALYCNVARPISGPFWRGSKGSDASIPPRRYDPKRAAALLAEAGWVDRDGDGVLDNKGRPFRFTYLRFSGSNNQRRLLPILKEAFRKAGLDMRTETLAWSAALGRMKAQRFDLTDLNWHYYFEQDLYQIYHSSQCGGGSNYGCYKNAKVDALLTRIRLTLDATKRQALERKLHRLLHDDPPGIYLLNVGHASLISRRFDGLRPSPAGFVLRDARPVKGAQK